MIAHGGHIAQWIEHQVPVLGVGGSNPSMLVNFSNLVVQTYLDTLSVGEVKP